MALLKLKRRACEWAEKLALDLMKMIVPWLTSFKLAPANKHRLLTLLPLAGVLFATLIIRLYKIDSPLWFDELYAYRLAKLGVGPIIQNSWTDPQPPLYYLLQWAAAGWINPPSELGWRWMSLVYGVLVVFSLSLIVGNVTDRFTSLSICLLVATLPRWFSIARRQDPMPG